MGTSKALDKKKIDCATRLRSIGEDFLRYASQDFFEYSENWVERINENVIGLLNFEKPRVMVYGIYNSGKSTLINALCKEERAETADRPMTAQIAEFDHGDYVLIDSPGVDAPIEHEEVTEKYISKCHIILFVISTKGMFEDRDNYRRLAELIERDVPFIIVLNDKGGCQIKQEWTNEQKKRAEFEHEHELKTIQHKVIKNLMDESKDKKIDEKYEVVVLNAKKAITGIQKNKPQLYDISKVGFLDTRITQLLQSSKSIKALFQQPISNLKDCMNELEKLITQEMNGNKSEDFGTRMEVLAAKKDNIMQDMKVLAQQAVSSHLEELTNFYYEGSSDVFEIIVDNIFMDIDERYSARLNEFFVYVDRNFREFHLQFDTNSNLKIGDASRHGRQITIEPEGMRENQHIKYLENNRKSSFLDLFKSRQKKEEEKYERWKREAEIQNQQAQYQVQEQIRRKQEAKQLASSDLMELLQEINGIITQGITEKYRDIMTQIQQLDCLNKQKLEDGQRHMQELNRLRDRMMEIENTLI